MYLSFVISFIFKFESPLLIFQFFDLSNFKHNSELICILIVQFFIFFEFSGSAFGSGALHNYLLSSQGNYFCKSNHFLICSSSLLIISYHSPQFICFGFNSAFTWCNRTHPSHYHLKFFILPHFCSIDVKFLII